MFMSNFNQQERAQVLHVKKFSHRVQYEKCQQSNY